MSTQLAPKQDELPEAIMLALSKGDISRLSDADKVRYYNLRCERAGLDPITKPFDYITLNGKLTLYANKNAAEGLRLTHGISLEITSRDFRDDLFLVTCKATNRDGRYDESMGAVAIAGLKGENLANALMKAETKAKRRVTFAITGLGMLDETEVEDIPGAQKEPAPAVAEAPENGKPKRARARRVLAPEPEPELPPHVEAHLADGTVINGESLETRTAIDPETREVTVVNQEPEQPTLEQYADETLGTTFEDDRASLERTQRDKRAEWVAQKCSANGMSDKVRHGKMLELFGARAMSNDGHPSLKMLTSDDIQEFWHYVQTHWDPESKAWKR